METIAINEKTVPVIKLRETKHPHGGVKLYNPKFRDMAIEQIEQQEQEKLQGYANVGYNSFTFNRACGLVSIQKIETCKTLKDIFNTDMYGLLED